MAIIPNFSAAQPLGSPSVIQITDTSVGSDVAIAGRRVYLRDYAGADVLPSDTTTDYVVWDILDTSINISALSKDMALLITVQWLDALGGVLYDTSRTIGFTSWNEDFAYALTQMLTANPLRVNDSGFLSKFSEIRNFIDSGNQALERQSDMYSAQRCYDAATYIRINSGSFFNLVS